MCNMEKITFNRSSDNSEAIIDADLVDDDYVNERDIDELKIIIEQYEVFNLLVAIDDYIENDFELHLNESYAYFKKKQKLEFESNYGYYYFEEGDDLNRCIELLSNLEVATNAFNECNIFQISSDNKAMISEKYVGKSIGYFISNKNHIDIY